MQKKKSSQIKSKEFLLGPCDTTNLIHICAKWTAHPAIRILGFYFYTRNNWFVFQVLTLLWIDSAAVVVQMLCELLLGDGISVEGDWERRGEVDILPLWQEGSLGVSRDLWSERRCSISLRGMRQRPPLLHKNPESQRGFPLQTWCLQQTRCCLFSGDAMWLLRVIVSSASAPARGWHSLSSDTSPPTKLSSIFMNVCSISWKPRRPSRVWRAPTSNSTAWVWRRRRSNWCIPFIFGLNEGKSHVANMVLNLRFYPAASFSWKI